MTRTPFDQFSKQYLQTFLAPWGQTILNQEIPGEAKFIDLWFVPFSQPQANSASLGLLGRFATTPCLLEPFRNSPSPEQVCSCLHKLFHVRADAQRQAKREKRTLGEAELPRLWILAPSASQRLLNGFNLHEQQQQWGPGMHFWGEFERAAIVAINQLPATPDSLWLRLLGKGATQAQAIEEVLALPKSSPLRANALELLTVWKISIEMSPGLEQEERELAMTLSKAYLEWKQETEQQALQRGIQQGVQQGLRQGVQQGLQQGVQQGLQQGVQQGLQQGVQQGLQQGVQQERQTTIEHCLTARFGALDEGLAAIVQPFSALPALEYAALLLQLSSLSREALLAKFEDASGR